VHEAAKSSMGQEFSEVDEKCLKELCLHVIKQFEFRKDIAGYLKDRMMAVSPNLTEIVGENVGAKLISHAGGMANLVKYPASTI